MFVARYTGALRGIVVAWSALWGGCFPYAVPPTEASLGVGAATDSVRSQSFPPPERESPTVLRLRGSVRPLAAVPKLRGRIADPGVGYSWERVDLSGRAHAVHGPYVESDLFVLPARSRNGSPRAGLRGSADLLFTGADGGATGWGGSLGTFIEYSAFTAGSYEETDDEDGTTNVGSGMGEYGIGLLLGAAHRRIADQSYWAGFLAISVRWPVAVGVVCCALPGDDDDDGYETYESEPAPRDPEPGDWPLRRPSDPERVPGPRRDPDRTPADPRPGPRRTPADPE